MCSNCSGDDLRPESFAIFDVSSPKTGRSFAICAEKKRKRYRTSRILRMLTQSPLTQAILRALRTKGIPRITGMVDRGSFVNLNLSTPMEKLAAKKARAAQVGQLVEICVSPGAIIEVFANPGEAEKARSEYALTGGQYLFWREESCAEETELQRAIQSFRRTRQLKYFMAYSVFAIVAAAAVWCAIR
jgi:hypothetical protein